ncbi:fibroblast growth factor 8-like [Oppia nitens]|uniref:fibroblast growth factor 8-like n=1 Tax=Oppia nitens TaxID=1686743 RepID=UPI0023DB32F2|nr:fibroblast growth factor 8-like [Oppia nitens]
MNGCFTLFLTCIQLLTVIHALRDQEVPYIAKMDLKTQPVLHLQHQPIRYHPHRHRHHNHHHNRHRHQSLLTNQNFVNNLTITSSNIHNNHNKHLNSHQLIKHESLNPINDRISTSRQFVLYSRCSQDYVSVLHQSINAKAMARYTKSHPNTTTSSHVIPRTALLSFETERYDNNIAVRIKSVPGGVYLCFNNRGRLTTKYSSDKDIECHFTEEVTEKGYLMLRSVYNRDWYIGFNKNGLSMKGQITTSSKQSQHLKRKKYAIKLT